MVTKPTGRRRGRPKKPVQPSWPRGSIRGDPDRYIVAFALALSWSNRMLGEQIVTRNFVLGAFMALLANPRGLDEMLDSPSFDPESLIRGGVFHQRRNTIEKKIVRWCDSQVDFERLKLLTALAFDALKNPDPARALRSAYWTCSLAAEGDYFKHWLQPQLIRRGALALPGLGAPNAPRPGIR